MFGFLSRKLGASVSSSGTVESASNPVPSPECNSAEPPITPSPSPQDLITDPNPLYNLILSIPAQTLHAYTLAHLIPPSQPLSPLSFPHIPLPSEPPSPRTLTTLTNFYANLVPPPRLHCVRCHKGYFEIENTDRSCLVPHDDESAEVERVGAIARSKGLGTEYETLWGCCGKTVEGDGDMGPPDGWCYEGKHTTDIKRARFRADSTPNDDKLASCERLRCHEPPSSSPRATRGGATKRRRALIEEADNEDARSSADGSSVSGASSGNMAVDEPTSIHKPKRARHSKSVSIASKADLEKLSKGGDVVMMDVDQSQAQVPVTPKSPPRPRKPRKSGASATTLGAKPRSKAKSPLTSSFTPPSPPTEDSTQAQPETERAPVSRAIVEITTQADGSPRLHNSKSQGHLRKSSNASLASAFKEINEEAQDNKEKPKPKPRARRNTVGASTPKTPKTPKTTVKPSEADCTTARTPTAKPDFGLAVKPKSSVKSTSVKPASNVSSTPTSQKPVSRAGSTRKKSKALNEVVATSVDGEESL